MGAGVALLQGQLYEDNNQHLLVKYGGQELKPAGVFWSTWASLGPWFPG